MKNESYIINDTDKFVDSMRKIVFSSFGKQTVDNSDSLVGAIDQLSKEEQQELDSVLSFAESSNIVLGLVKKQKNKNTQEIRYLVDDNIFNEIIDSLNSRLVSNILSSLTQKGIVETAYDNDLNDFVFWIKTTEN